MNVAQSSSYEPLFDPNFLNLEYFFSLLFRLIDFLRALIDYLLSLLNFGDGAFLRALFWILVIALVLAITYIVYSYLKLRREEREEFLDIHFAALNATPRDEANIRWQAILDLVESDNESDWRRAILDADSILGDLLEKMGYEGDSIGEKMKGIEISDFLTLPQAWEAHKVRNRIAHDGGGFGLTSREARRIIDLYREVFEEFHFI